MNRDDPDEGSPLDADRDDDSSSQAVYDDSSTQDVYQKIWDLELEKQLLQQKLEEVKEVIDEPYQYPDISLRETPRKRRITEHGRALTVQYDVGHADRLEALEEELAVLRRELQSLRDAHEADADELEEDVDRLGERIDGIRRNLPQQIADVNRDTFGLFPDTVAAIRDDLSGVMHHNEIIARVRVTKMHRESAVAVIIGLATVFLGGGVWYLSEGPFPVVFRLVLTSSIIIVGLGLAVAGLLDKRKLQNAEWSKSYR